MRNKTLLLALFLIPAIAFGVTYGSNCDVSVGLCDNAVNSAKIENGTILSEDISSSAAITLGQLAVEALRSADVTIANAALDTMNATPVTLVAAGGSNTIHQVVSVFCINNFVTAALELGSGTLDVRYENSSGGLAAQFTNAWAESAATAYFSAPGLAVIGLANKAIVMHASADITSGGGNLHCRTIYRTITVF